MVSTKFKKIRNLALAQMVIILALVIALIWALFIRETEPEALTVSADASAQLDEPQVRRLAVINKEESLYQLDGKKILLDDGTYGEIYLPVYADVPASSVDTEAVISRNGYSFYKENNEITSIPGIDVSVYQGTIDWQQVKAAGVEFAMIRVGIRTYGGGRPTSCPDQLACALKEAKEA